METMVNTGELVFYHLLDLALAGLEDLGLEHGIGGAARLSLLVVRDAQAAGGP